MSVNFKPQKNSGAKVESNNYWIWKNHDENILVDKYDFRNKILSRLAPEAQYETVRVLNELIEAHYDRMLDYELAMNELTNEDADLKILFTILLEDSREHIADLTAEIQAVGGDVVKGSNNTGNSYFRWTNFKRSDFGNKRRQILLMCGETQDFIQQKYKEASLEEDLPAAIKSMILSQASSFKIPAANIRNLSELNRQS